MAKVYEYNGRHYCEEDLSETDDDYDGDLFALYWQASNGSLNGELCESTVYYSAGDPETVYDSPEELVENYFRDKVIKEVPDSIPFI